MVKKIFESLCIKDKGERLVKKFFSKFEIEYFIVFFIFIILSLLIPLTSGDDFNWGTETGLARLANHFENYNGRYVGNLIIIAITRIALLRIIFYASINTLMVYSISKLSFFTNKKTPYLVTLMLLAIPYTVYAQTFGWYAGFANYNVAISLTLFIWTILVKEKNTIIDFVILVPISIAAQLCMENVTIFNIIISLTYLIIRLKKKPLKELFYFVFSILGAIIMFSNGAYQTIAGNNDVYRSYDISTITDVLFTSFSQFYFVDNWLIMISLGLITFFLYREKKAISYFIKLILILFPASTLMLSNINVTLNKLPGVFSISFFFGGLIFLLSIVHVVTTLEIDIQKKVYMIFLGFCSALIISPMLLIKPFGPRVMLTSYVFFVLLLNNLINVYLNQKLAFVNDRKFFQGVKKILLICFVLLVGIHGVNLYSINYRSEKFDINHKNKTITTYQVPFEQYGHFISPPGYNEVAKRTFRRHYHLPEDYDIIFQPYLNSLLDD